ncbi:MAG TPA: MaoC family dehydratase N-terminal domain-containing protein [Actinomycetota bacterium]|nr:MaoC family dehydratase N-terminal domain-containing protein [Actinomycetota bacterium]
MNVAAAGKVYPEVPFTVDPERVAAFRAVFDEVRGVPATFATTAEFTVIPDVVADPELELDFTRVLHGSQGYEFARPLKEGERLTIRSKIESIREMGGNGFLLLATELLDVDGVVVCTARSTLIEQAAD